MRSSPVSSKTFKFWLIDTFLFVSSLAVIFSGLYFLFFPLGFQGGRNSFYNVQIVFDRFTWDSLHTWFGIAMIGIALIHLLFHWDWLTKMAKKLAVIVQGKACGLTKYGLFNVWLDFTIAISFIIAAISGVNFLFSTGGSLSVRNQDFLFSRTAWDLIHTWSGILMTIAAIVHFVIHWRWVVNVSKRVVVNLFSKQELPQPVGLNVIGSEAITINATEGK